MRKSVIGLLLIAAGTVSVANAGKPAGGGDTPSYAGTNLGTLPGDKHSDAWGVNARGHVVGRSYNSSRQSPTLLKAFYWDGTMHQLQPATEAPTGETPWDSEAWAISNETTETVVGLEERTVCIEDPNDPTLRICEYPQYPLVWQDPGVNPVADRLDESSGRAFGINDAGNLAVGSCGGGFGAIWSRSGSGGWSRTNIQEQAFPDTDLVAAFPDGHDLTGHDIDIVGGAYDVNDAGVVIGTLTWIDQTAVEACRQTDVRPCAEDVAYSRAYVYFANSATGQTAGTGRVLPAPVGYSDSNGFALSNLGYGGTAVYVAGWAKVSPNHTWGKGARWTVTLDGQSGLDVQTELLDQQAWSQGVNEAGDVAGTSNSRTDRRGNIIQTATLFRQSVGYVTLKPPKGGSDSTSRGMAGTGPIYVVGEANVKGAWRAARWVIPQ